MNYLTSLVAVQTFGNLTAAAALCFGLAACGGGAGGGGNASTAGNPTAPLPAPVTVAAAEPMGSISAPATSPVPTPASAPAAGDFSCGLNGAAGIEAEVLQRVNALRASGAVCGAARFQATGGLAWNAQLLQAAKGHAADMAQKNYFSHTSQDGRTAAQRVTSAGYIWSNVGENIAAGQRSVQEVMTDWEKSPGHCQNLMNPNFQDVAVACVRNDATAYRLYWTMELGRRI